MSTTGVWEIQDAMVLSLEGDSALRTALGTGKKVHDMVVVAGTVMPYIVIGNNTETSQAVFGRGGHDSTIALHIWTKEASKRRGMEIYDHLHRLLHRKPLVLTGGRSMVTGALSWVMGLTDPVTGGFHGVASYEALTRGAV